ncbi:MAG: metallophosphoesterase family protein [Candidatus Dormibacteraeota bacterium]|uniref:Metallophosphoesterase family protein n=1 Tax=Candidatus Dormiibacter inghamiae TaxID=3127013 RepID=A0A934K4Z3_9BACT|nr:metallophosphoesterase family protein [Candidatus Dormibacteraeota bacterium]MBJ7605881.1 metallophosphoesterase family protein [Candidatus Dormibacteraeota bacterium]
MRLAIVSDIHGNLAALEAVIADLERQSPDLVVHGGDLAFNGPLPAEVLDRVRALGWPGVVGNTDQALWGLPPSLSDSARAAFDQMVAATSAALGEERIAWLHSLPLEWRRHSEVALVHAVPGDTWHGVMPDAPDAELFGFYGPLGASLAVYCHIHRPYIRRLPSLTVANAGSVGLPYDGDTRSSYLIIEDGEPSVRRVEYDRDRHLADLKASGYPTARWLAEQARTAAGGFPKVG